MNIITKDLAPIRASLDRLESFAAKYGDKLTMACVHISWLGNGIPSLTLYPEDAEVIRELFGSDGWIANGEYSSTDPHKAVDGVEVQLYTRTHDEWAGFSVTTHASAIADNANPL